MTRVSPGSLAVFTASALMLAPGAGAAERAAEPLFGRDAAGRVNLTIHLPGGSAADPVETRAIGRAARRMLRERADSYGLGAGDDPGRIALDEPEAVTDQIVRVAARETWQGMRVLGSEMSLLFARDGRYLGFVGRFTGHGGAASDAAFDAARALDVLDARGELAPATRRIERVRDHLLRVRTAKDEETLEAERVVSPEHGTVAWELRGPDRTWLVSETTGEILSTREHVVHYGDSIVRRDVVRATVRPQTADWRTGLGSLTTWSPASTKVMKRFLDPGNTLCQYTLQSGLGTGTRNEAFPRVDDRSGVDDYVTIGSFCTASTFNEQPCGLAFQCDPLDNDGSFYRQQTYHSYLTEALDVLRSEVHPFVPTDSGWDVSLAIDEPLTGVCGNDSGCFAFNPWYRAIHMTTNRASIGVLWHELGHYFDWSYGWLGGNCNDADESIAVKETLADVVASLLAKREFDPRYRDRYTRSQYEFGMHSNNSNRQNFVAGGQGCAANGTYGMGEAFYQAMWEIAFGFNCDQAACTDTNATGVSTRASPGDINWASNQEASEQLLRSLAFALKVSGSGITFRQLAALIYIDTGSRFGGVGPGTRAADIQAIFAHHGLM